jgi:hypothetical protein
MHIEELAQPTMPGLKPRSLKIQNITKVTVTNTGNGAQVELHGPHAETHALKLQPGDSVRLDLIEPTIVHITER